MNKYQEALDKLNKRKLPLEIENDIKILEELVIKEIPHYVHYEYDGYADGCPVYDIAYCPSCGRYFEVDYEEHYDYCPSCGQRLNWIMEPFEEDDEEEMQYDNDDNDSERK